MPAFFNTTSRRRKKNILYMQFNFAEYKKLLCTAFQTTDFDIAFKLGKQYYLQTFDEYLPYPIKDYPEEYQLFTNLLNQRIEIEGIIEVSLISKTEAKVKYQITDRFFDLFYINPEKEVLIANSRERFGKKMYSKLYNQNKIVQILDSEEYQMLKELKQNKKNLYFKI